MKRRTTSLQLISTISLTSMMDVAFNLLIAFMIVAPALKHGMKIELPEVAATNLKPRKSLTIVIRKAPQPGEEERIYLDNRRISIDDLADKLTSIYERKPDIDILLEADKSVPYGTVARVLHAIQKVGVEGVGLVTEPPFGKGKR